MKNPYEDSPVDKKLVRRYTIIFVITTLIGMVMVFLAVAGRRHQLMEDAKNNKGLNPAAGAHSLP